MTPSDPAATLSATSDRDGTRNANRKVSEADMSRIRIRNTHYVQNETTVYTKGKQKWASCTTHNRARKISVGKIASIIIIV